MELNKVLEGLRQIISREEVSREEIERFQKFFERFHLINRSYLDKETFKKAEGSISSMSETISDTLKYLEEEMTRLRNKRLKRPYENVELAEMQKVQNKNEILIKELLAEYLK